MWHYNRVLKGLTFTMPHLNGRPYSAHWQPPITLGRAGVRRPGLGRAERVGRDVNGLWEDSSVDE